MTAPTDIPFPLRTILLSLTAAAIAVAAAAWFASGAATVYAVAIVWVINVASVMMVGGFAARGAFATAMAHYAAAGGRMLLCIGAAYWAIKQYGLPQSTTLTAMAAAYLPLLMVESVLIARHIRRTFRPAKARVTA